MGSLVVKNVESLQVVGGNPAKHLFNRENRVEHINPSFERFWN